MLRIPTQARARAAKHVFLGRSFAKAPPHKEIGSRSAPHKEIGFDDFDESFNLQQLMARRD